MLTQSHLQPQRDGLLVVAHTNVPWVTTRVPTMPLVSVGCPQANSTALYLPLQAMEVSFGLLLRVPTNIAAISLTISHCISITRNWFLPRRARATAIPSAVCETEQCRMKSEKCRITGAANAVAPFLWNQLRLAVDRKANNYSPRVLYI